jgi:hypothetical protein
MVNPKTKAVKDFSILTLFVLSLTAVFWIENQIILFVITFSSLLVVAWGANARREVWPILFIILLLLTVEIIIGLSIPEPIIFFLILSLFDLFIAFSIVHFHREKFLLHLCRAPYTSRQVPQVYLISFVLALSSLYSFLLGSEMVFVKLEPNLFENSPPFFASVFMPVKITFKILFDLTIWSLVLEPTRWKFLRKLENYFYS